MIILGISSNILITFVSFLIPVFPIKLIIGQHKINKVLIQTYSINYVACSILLSLTPLFFREKYKTAPSPSLPSAHTRPP